MQRSSGDIIPLELSFVVLIVYEYYYSTIKLIINTDRYSECYQDSIFGGSIPCASTSALMVFIVVFTVVLTVPQTTVGQLKRMLKDCYFECLTPS